MKLDIYANYGMLTNEKRTIYTLTPDVLTSRHNKPALLIPGPAMYHGYVALETV